MKYLRSWSVRTPAVVVAVPLAMFAETMAHAQKTIEVVSGAMEPTLHQKQEVRIDLFAYTFAAPARGDVVVFLVPSGSEYRMYRVVALPGDTIAYDADRQLNINGVEVRRMPTDAPAPPTWAKSKTFVEELPGARHLVLLEPEKGLVLTFPGLTNNPDCVTTVGAFSCKVPANRYFLMGDNREHAMDSRALGFIPAENITARVRIDTASGGAN